MSPHHLRTEPGPTPTVGPDLVTTVVPVAGMTCRSCESRIERHVRRIPNVERVSASAGRARVEVVSDGPLSPAALAAAVQAAGYQVGRTPWLERDRRVWMTAAAGLAIVVTVAILANVTGLGRLASGVGDLREGGLVVALLLGLVAGVSTCMALVGGLVLALSAAFVARRDPDSDISAVQRLRPGVVFVTGRIVGFAVLGALLGGLGASLAMPAELTAFLMIAVAVLMTILGTRLTGVSPRIAAWSPTLPTRLSRSLGIEGGQVTAYSDTRAAALGAASFFLPCGFTQAVQVYALSTGSPVVAGATMAVFALGTAPGLLALAGLPALVPTTGRPTLLRLVGVLVIGFAVVNATGGLRLAGVALPFDATTVAAAPVGDPGARVQVLHTFQGTEGYFPGSASIYAGRPTHWIVESLDSNSCATFLRVPGLGLEATLHKGENVIELPALRPGTVPYTCAMGMYGGVLTVVPAPAGTVDGVPGGG